MKPLPRLVVFFLASFMGIFIWWLMKPGKMGIPFDSYSIPVNFIALFVCNFFILGLAIAVFISIVISSISYIIFLLIQFLRELISAN